MTKKYIYYHYIRWHNFTDVFFLCSTITHKNPFIPVEKMTQGNLLYCTWNKTYTLFIHCHGWNNPHMKLFEISRFILINKSYSNLFCKFRNMFLTCNKHPMQVIALAPKFEMVLLNCFGIELASLLAPNWALNERRSMWLAGTRALYSAMSAMLIASHVSACSYTSSIFWLKWGYNVKVM